MSTVAEIASLLAGHDVPADVVDELIDGLPGTVVLDEPADVLAADLAVCHPSLGPSEVRVTLRADGEHSRRITVVAHDRRGLLAATAGALAGMGLSVVTVSAATWEHRAVALQGITVVDPQHQAWGPQDWERVRAEVEAVVAGTRSPAVTFRPAGPVKVVASPVLDGQTLVTVDAPDRVGLLWAIASWFEVGGYNVLAARLDDDGLGTASGALLVDRAPDVNQLVEHLAGKRRRSLITRLGDRRTR